MNDREQELRTMPYSEYLLTPEWQERRKGALESAEGRCMVCYTSEGLDVHHRTYARRGAEKPSDLIVLCHEDHQRFHDKLPAPPTPFNWLGQEWSDEGLESKTFENFDQSRSKHAHEVAFQLVVDYIELGNPRSFLLSGEYQSGKTHLLAAIGNALEAAMSDICFYVSAPKLFAVIQQRQNTGKDYLELIRQAGRVPLLLIDDVDRARKSDFREEMYFLIINERVNLGRRTVVASNDVFNLAHFMGDAAYLRLTRVADIVETGTNEHTFDYAPDGEDYRESL